jgi:acyl-homoserine lactone acylase PvdQ
LAGVARDGGFDTLNQGTHSDGDTPGAMRFSRGATERLVMSPRRPTVSGSGMQGLASVQGGSSGDPASPGYASQLASWLTVDYHPVPMSKKQVRRRRHTTERFVPLKPKTAAAIRGGAHGSE